MLGLGLWNFAAAVGALPIALSSATVAENDAGAVIGTLALVAEGAGTVQSWTVDDARFEVDGSDQLKLKAGQSLDYETESNVSVVVSANDGSTLYTQGFNIVVIDVLETDLLHLQNGAALQMQNDAALELNGA
jgi:hypothetical protein